MAWQFVFQATSISALDSIRAQGLIASRDARLKLGITAGFTNLNLSTRAVTEDDRQNIFFGSFATALKYAREEINNRLPPGPMAILRALVNSADLSGEDGLSGWRCPKNVPPRMLFVVVARPRWQWEPLVNTSPPSNIFNFLGSQGNFEELVSTLDANVPDRANPPRTGPPAKKFVFPTKVS